MHTGLHVKYTLFLSHFNKTLILSTYFYKNIKISPVGVDLLRADSQTDGQTGMKKLIVNFRNFANAPKNPEERSVISEAKISEAKRNKTHQVK
jgi:hypothetical protein